MSKKRRVHSAQFKAQVGLDALKGVEPVHAIAAKHGVHPVQVSQCVTGHFKTSQSGSIQKQPPERGRDGESLGKKGQV